MPEAGARPDTVDFFGDESDDEQQLQPAAPAAPAELPGTLDDGMAAEAEAEDVPQAPTSVDKRSKLQILADRKRKHAEVMQLPDRRLHACSDPHLLRHVLRAITSVVTCHMVAICVSALRLEASTEVYVWHLDWLLPCCQALLLSTSVPGPLAGGCGS